MELNKIHSKDFHKGFCKTFPPITFTENEIIDFAKEFDPLPFHTDIKAAEKSIFGQLVASGSQPFVAAHKRYCIPFMGQTFLAGLGITEWYFFKPVYPNHSINLSIEIEEISPNERKTKAKIVWIYFFKDSKKNLVQSLKSIVLHKIA